MNFFKRTISRKHAPTRTYSYTTPTTPTSPVSNILDDVEEDEIDYSPIIQQEATGIDLQKLQRTMIEEKAKAFKRWSTEHKEWTEKFKGALKTKDASFQSYTTTVKLFEVTLSLCDQLGAEFDESNKELEKLLRKIPKHEKPSVKLELAQETAVIKQTRRDLDNLATELRHTQDNLEETRKDLRSSHLSTRKQNKLQEREETLIQDKKRLKKKIQKQQETCRQVQKQYHVNTENIYQQSQENESARLTNIPGIMKKFIAALNIEPASLEEAIQKHEPKTDLTSWREKYFSASLKQTEV